jgi:hypothetical protein
MTYEDRQHYRQQRVALEELRGRIESGDPESPLTRSEALEILELLEQMAERISPERWDQTLEAIVGEAARRAEMLAARRG